MKQPEKNSNVPLVSIITVVYNGAEFIEQTIKSVIEQTYGNVEYIIIDGGSTDGTIDIIKKYEDKISYWVSEPDKGIYDAMNKGIKASRGDIIGFINADDYYVKDAFDVIKKYRYNIENIIIYGDTYLVTNDMLVYEKAHKTGLKYKIFPYSLKYLWLGMIFCHQSSFVSRKIYENFGLFDTSFKISADYDFFFRVYMSKKVRFVYENKLLSYFRCGGISSSQSEILFIENNRVRKKYSLVIGYFIEIVLFLKNVVKYKILRK